MIKKSNFIKKNILCTMFRKVGKNCRLWESRNGRHYKNRSSSCHLFHNYKTRSTTTKSKRKSMEQNPKKFTVIFMKYSLKLLHKIIPSMMMVYACWLFRKVLYYKFQFLKHLCSRYINFKIDTTLCHEKFRNMLEKIPLKT